MGCMRFPKTRNSGVKNIIDEPESIKMIQYAVDNGVNYFDTAYTYEHSEEILGKALSKGLRERVFIATKSPVYIIKKSGDFDKYLDEELKRLQTNYIDFYLLHMLHKNSWEKVNKLRLLDKLITAKKEGKIKYMAF